SNTASAKPRGRHSILRRHMKPNSGAQERARLRVRLDHDEHGVSHRALSLLVGWLVDDSSFDNHRRRSTAVEVHRLPGAELAHHVRQLDERHAATVLGTTIDGKP